VTSRSSTLLDMEERRLEGLARASVNYDNSEEEVERFCAAVASDRR
jgi:cysteine desulfurase / selenocysteine lyase